MAGVGMKLNRLIEKRPAAVGLADMAYCCSLPAALLLLAGAGLLLGWLLGLKPSELYSGPFSRTLCGILAFSLLIVSPLGAVLSKQMQDSICEGRLQDIRPAYRVGLALAILLACLLGIPFFLWVPVAGGVFVPDVPAGFCCGLCLILALYSLLCPFGLKEYGKASLFFLTGLLAAFLFALLFCFGGGREAGSSILLALSAGFSLTAMLGYAFIRRHFAATSGRFWPVLHDIGRHWPLFFSHLFFALGLCIPQIAFWAAGRQSEAEEGFACPAYFAMLANALALLSFAARADRRLHGSYRAYSDALSGGRLADIRQAKRWLCRELWRQARDFTGAQFILSACVCLLLLPLGPRLGFPNATMWAYPCLAACFLLMQTYAGILLLSYVNDLGGALLTALTFCLPTILSALLAARLPDNGGGLGILSGALAGWVSGYLCLGWALHRLEVRMLCQGTLLERGRGARPQDEVFVKAAEGSCRAFPSAPPE